MNLGTWGGLGGTSSILCADSRWGDFSKILFGDHKGGQHIALRGLPMPNVKITGFKLGVV